MMAYHQRVSQYRSPRRIDFDDPSTTKPPSLAKSAVLAALEEEEREKSRGTAAFGRQSRSRQPTRPTDPRTVSPCIDRETVLKINRRPLQRRHRSCDNFWPPRSPATGEAHGRHRSPARDEGEFAIDSQRYGSHDSIHFDERIRRQHKIEPLRTLFDKENVVLTDWGQRPSGHELDKNDNHVYGSDVASPAAHTAAGDEPCRHTTAGHDNHKALRADDFTEGCLAPQRPATPARLDWPDDKQDDCMLAGELAARPEVHAPEPPPRRYYLPMDKIAGGELEAMLRLFQDTPITPPPGQHHRGPSPAQVRSPVLGRRSATPSYGGPQAQLPERSKSVQGQAVACRERNHPNQTSTLRQDGIESKPPLKLKSSTGRTTPRGGTLQRHPTVTDVSCIEAIDSEHHLALAEDAPDDVDAVAAHHEFNLNSNTGWNLNIDRHRAWSPQPPTQSCTDGHISPVTVVTCPVSATIPPPPSVTIGADQLTTNYFDKHAHPHPSTVEPPALPRFPAVLSVPPEPCPGFPLLLEIERADHKFDSNVNYTGQSQLAALDEFHNYNEKLITDRDGTSPGRGSASTPQLVDWCRITENRRQSHSSTLNVSNQPNRNWINLNSNQIYHQQRASPRDPVCQRMSARDSSAVVSTAAIPDRSVHSDPTNNATTGATSPESDRSGRATHVAYGDNDSAYDQNANDNLQRRTADQQQPDRLAVAAERPGCNYDNKSVRSHYRREASDQPSDNGQLPVDAPPHPRYVTPSPPLPPYPGTAALEPPIVPWRPRARSGSSGSSVKINEIFEFPPPPPYPCDCADGDGVRFEDADADEPSCGMTVYRCRNVSGSKSNGASDASDDTGWDYSTSGLKRVAWPPPTEGPEYEVHPSQQKQHAVGQQIPPQQQQQQFQPQQFYQQTNPQQQQQQYQPAYQQTSFPPQQQQQHPHQPVERIVPIQRPEAQQQQPLAPQYQNPLEQQPYQPQPTEAFQPLTAQQQQPLYQPAQPQQHQQLPPTLITTLRKEPPMSQEPAPVYQTQPVAAIYQGGSNMRGDQKWPPEEYKRQSEVDNEERRKLAQQPAFRPRRQQKDYADFFAKNALNNTYPGYRAPPGTQHHA